VSGRVSIELARADGTHARAVADSWRELAVRADGRELRLDGLSAEGGLCACLACAHRELYTQKDFPRRVGLAIVVAAALAAPFTWYASLVGAALLDAALYRFAPDVVVCYACGARHRGFAARPRHPGFDRQIAERLRYGERAVMGKPMHPGGTAGAPEPEH
jgi:hypothetical protein